MGMSSAQRYPRPAGAATARRILRVFLQRLDQSAIGWNHLIADKLIDS
jgi:hypothetical protein